MYSFTSHLVRRVSPSRTPPRRAIPGTAREGSPYRRSLRVPCRTPAVRVALERRDPRRLAESDSRMHSTDETRRLEIDDRDVTDFDLASVTLLLVHHVGVRHSEAFRF